MTRPALPRSEAELDALTYPAKRRPVSAAIANLQKFTLCVKCWQRTTRRSLEDHDGMCPSCYRLWSRPTTEELASYVPADYGIQLLRTMGDSGKGPDMLVATARRECPLPVGEWDARLVRHVVYRAQDALRNAPAAPSAEPGAVRRRVDAQRARRRSSQDL